VSGGEHDLHNDRIHWDIPHHPGDIVVQKTFETSTTKLEIRKDVAAPEWNDDTGV